MTIDFLLPAVAGLQLRSITYAENHIILSLINTHPTTACPVCGCSSDKIHSRYQRRVADLPWSDKQIQLHLNVRRFFCPVEDCKRKVFSERLHLAIKAWARRTSRLDHYLETLALKVGGEGAALLCHLLNISTVSADTLLKLSRKAPLAHLETVPKIVGIDEWAIWKGHTYATIIVDLERRRPIELLADAELTTVEAWFKAHPEVKIISRDRDTVFAEAGRKGAPNAVQVADRWHLLKNLGDAVKRTLDLNQAALRATAGAIAGFGKGKTDTPTQATTTAQPAPPQVPLPSRPREGLKKKQ